jgi:hypothetical protein
MQTTYTAERWMDAPADVIYRCLADYRQHHRPGGFLPDAFSDLEVLEGGVGAGSRVRWDVTTGGRRRTITATISEPQPGQTLVETADGLVTTFTVEPGPGGALVRFRTVFDEPGLSGLLTRLFAPRLLAPIYADELTRLERYARALAREAA